jgi:antitoxin MazE
MRIRVQKWGNGLALRIPKSFAVEAGIDQDTEVDIALVNGKLILTPLSVPVLTLEQLLAEITDNNLHRENDTGTVVGSQIPSAKAAGLVLAPPTEAGAAQ